MTTEETRDTPDGATAVDERSASPGRAVLLFLREIVIVVVLALALSFVAKTWLVQSFWIPSDSMNNTLVRADRVMVNKLRPGPMDLRRGDIVVFTDPGGWLRGSAPVPQQSGVSGAISKALAWVGLMPADEGNHLIKRVIGLPGDHVQCCGEGGRLTVNGTAISEPYIYPGNPPSEIPFDVTVPAGKIWVMGDHRSDSADSRFNDVAPAGGGSPDKDNTGYYGSVPIDDVVGTAFALVWPLNRMTWLGVPEETFASVPAASPTPSGNAPTGGGASSSAGVVPTPSPTPAP